MNPIIEIPVNPSLTLRQQIDSALAALAPYHCERHPHVTLELDREATLESFLSDSRHDTERWPWNRDEAGRNCYEFRQVFQRCPECPFNIGGEPIQRHWSSKESPCAATESLGHDEACSQDNPLPTITKTVEIAPDLTADQQFQAWLAKLKPLSCGYCRQPAPLERLRSELVHQPAEYQVHLRYPPCPQCWLEHRGIPPDEAFACFENFVVDPPAIAAHLEICRRFADKPEGVLLMIGSTGNGKTHLAYAIMRERFRRSSSGSIFIKQRHFLDRHWLDKRPLPFGEEKPKSILAKCQTAELLVFDELREATSNHDIEDPLLDLFEYRIGHHLPSVITANIKQAELETAIGSRLLDRLTKANFALLEFNFLSRRATLNSDYLARCAAYNKPTL